MEVPGMHDTDRYELVKDIGSGNFGVARLMRDKKTRELVAVKYIERGEKIDENVEREIINHRSLHHPNIVRFKEVMLTPTHLAIVMEYAAGGELFERISNVGHFSEDEVSPAFHIEDCCACRMRYLVHLLHLCLQGLQMDFHSTFTSSSRLYQARFFFQQLISGVSYCHSMEICHRDLKLENALLDGSPVPRLKICDFGYSKSLLHSQPKSRVGTPAYIAPEVLSKTEYDGKIADVWSCSVTLYVMLVGAYPFEDPKDPNNFRKTIERILNVQYTVPDNIQISAEGQNLLSHIFVANPASRITIPDIMKHEWFLKDLPADLKEGADMGNELDDPNHPPQNLDEIMRIIQEARVPPANTGLGHYLDDAGLDLDYMDNDADVDVDSSGEFVCAL